MTIQGEISIQTEPIHTVCAHKSKRWLVRIDISVVLTLVLVISAGLIAIYGIDWIKHLPTVSRS